MIPFVKLDGADSTDLAEGVAATYWKIAIVPAETEKQSRAGIFNERDNRTGIFDMGVIVIRRLCGEIGIFRIIQFFYKILVGFG